MSKSIFNKCEECNSPLVISNSKDNDYEAVLECSYCGLPIAHGTLLFEIEDDE